MKVVRPGWLTAPISDLTIKAQKLDPIETGRNQVRYVDIGALDGPTAALSEVPQIDAANAPSRCRQVIAAGDTLYSTVRPYLRKIAYVGDALHGEFASTGYCVLRPKDEIDSKYLFYFVQSQQFEEQILPLQKGVSYPAVLDREVKAQFIPYPALTQQQRMVEILEEHLSHLDAAARSLSAATSRAGVVRAKAFDIAMEGLLRHEVDLLGVVEIENGQTPKGLADRLIPECGQDCVPFYKVGDMNLANGRWMSESRQYAARSDLAALGVRVRPPGTVLIPKRGGAISTNKKRILSTHAGYDLNTMGLRPREGMSAEYLWHWLETIDLGRLADGSNVPQINAHQIRALRIPVPDLRTQGRVVQTADRVVEGANRLQAAIEAAQLRGQVLRRAVLAAAFEGKLTGRRTDAEVIEELAQG